MWVCVWGLECGCVLYERKCVCVGGFLYNIDVCGMIALT